MKKCIFNRAWIGKCGKPAIGDDNPFTQDINESDYCDDHRDKKCRCGAQATHECSNTIGPMVCGMPLCDDCRCGCANRSF